MHGLLVYTGGKARCIDVHCKRHRKIIAMLRRGMAALRIQTGRWSDLKREEWTCRQCSAVEVQGENHFLVKSEGLKQEREVVVICTDHMLIVHVPDPAHYHYSYLSNCSQNSSCQLATTTDHSDYSLMVALCYMGQPVLVCALEWNIMNM